MAEPFDSYPEKLRQSSNSEAPFFHRAADLFAVRGPVPESVKSRVSAIIEEGQYAVCRGAPAAEVDCVPVYRLEGGALPAVATGLVYVRFAEGISAADRGADLLAAGYRIERVPPYAPHTAWVIAADGNAARGLGEIGKLMSLPGVAHVEPQMLMPKTARGAL
ncbi:MAG: hypothetical protein AB1810_00935 [Pseudomonadota bacterium]